jgi:hypothetical protein
MENTTQTMREKAFQETFQKNFFTHHLGLKMLLLDDISLSAVAPLDIGGNHDNQKGPY